MTSPAPVPDLAVDLEDHVATVEIRHACRGGGAVAPHRAPGALYGHGSAFLRGEEP